MKFPVQEFIKFAKKHSVPDYVREGTTSVFEEVADAHSKAACYLAVFAKAAGSDVCPLSEQELGKRAEILGIQSDIASLLTNFHTGLRRASVKSQRKREQDQNKQASAGETYPIRNASEWQKAASWLKRNAYALPLSERRELGQRLCKTAEQFKQAADADLESFAGQGTCDIAQTAANLRKRAELIRISKLNTADCRRKSAEDLEDLAKIVELQPNQTRKAENLDKIASAMQFLDTEYGLQRHYGGFLEAPDNICYGIQTHKVAEMVKFGYRLPSGEIYDVRDFEKINLTDVLESFGTKVAAAFADGINVCGEKVAACIPFMGTVELDLFKGLLKEAQVFPKAVHRDRLSIQDLKLLGTFM